MRLRSVELTEFRNYERVAVGIPEAGAAFLGDNGQGKTNLLEAIYYLQIFRSFRGAPDAQLVRFGADVFRIEGEVARGRGRVTVAAAFRRADGTKRVTLDGAEPERLSDAVGELSAVVFSPTDTEVVAGSPSGRRRFLDILLSLADPGYLRALQRYRVVLRQRNALLRDDAPRAAVAPWDAELVRSGARVIGARLRWTAAHADPFAALYRAVSGGESGRMRYLPSVREAVEEDDVERAFEEALARSREREDRRGMTVVGPHRDDLRFEARERDLRAYGSGGQRRTAAIALRMVEADTLHETRRARPLILLDDVFAELDPGRSERILEWLAGHGDAQVLLTAPKPSDLAVERVGLPLFRVTSGRVSEF